MSHRQGDKSINFHLLRTVTLLLVATGLLNACGVLPSIPHLGYRTPDSLHGTPNNYLHHSEGTDLSPLQPVQQHWPQHIALLLPLEGSPLGRAGETIRRGFMAAAQEQYNISPTITVFNTAQQDIVSLYRQAVNSGNDFVVGPLSKENIDLLARAANINVPTLALNTRIDDRTPKNSLFEFGLSPEDEAEQAAEKILKDQHHTVLIIAHIGSWSARSVQAFSDRWNQLGGVLQETVYFDQQDSLNKTIKNALHIDQSQARARALRQVLQEKMRFIPRRRKDIEAIFLVALPDQARQILPLLKFYYGGSIPVYATSSVYTGTPFSRKDQDLNGIHFCDMPWVLSHPDTKTDAVRRSKLYALGMDAYRLVPYLNTPYPKVQLQGATGQLSLTADARIYRNVLWARIIHGVPTLP